VEQVSFEGAYQLFMNTDDCQGYSTAEQAETYVIFQDGINATFANVDDPAFSFDCQVARGELQCAGKNITLANSNDVWEISQMTFSYDSRSALTGVAAGIVRREDGSECPGTYYFSTIAPGSGSTASFVNEVLLGCTTSITANYPIEITENGTSATININGEVFDCTINNNELICSGAFHGESGAHFEYDEYRLWFNENNLIDGIARWTLFEGSNAVCIGNSTISAATSVSGTRSLQGLSGVSMTQNLLIDRLQYGAESIQP
jgi:hypothetical protein